MTRPLEKRRCAGISRKTGEQCKAFAVHGEQYCAGHLGLGKLDPHRAAEISAQVRRDTAEERRKAPIDVYRDTLARNAADYAERLDKIIRDGNDGDALRALEQLTSRVLGKPKEIVETVTDKPAELARLEDLSDEELWEAFRNAGGDRSAAS